MTKYRKSSQSMKFQNSEVKLIRHSKADLTVIMIWSYSALHLTKPCLKRPLLVMQSNVLGTDFLYLFVYKILLVIKPPSRHWLLMAQSTQTQLSTHKRHEFSLVSVIIWVIISLKQLQVVIGKFYPLI